MWIVRRLHSPSSTKRHHRFLILSVCLHRVMYKSRRLGVLYLPKYNIFLYPSSIAFHSTNVYVAHSWTWRQCTFQIYIVDCFKSTNVRSECVVCRVCVCGEGDVWCSDLLVALWSVSGASANARPKLVDA